MLKTKDSLVKQLLCRWWYALPAYPPKDVNYDALLAEKQLRQVEVKNWKLEPDEKNGKLKCFEMKGYQGVFRDSNGMLHDLRPIENRPSYSNMMKKEEKEIYKLLLKAYEGQLSQLKVTPKYSSEVDNLVSELEKEREKVSKLFDKKFN